MSAEERKAHRILVVFDGEAWFVRRVAMIEHDIDRDMKVYHCDQHLGGPFPSLDGAVVRVNQLIRDGGAR